MHSPYCIHIWHMNLPCGFAETFPAKTWRVVETKTNHLYHLTDHHMEELMGL